MAATKGQPLLTAGAIRSVETRSAHADDADTPTMHNPTPVGETGKVPMSDGTQWVATDPAAVLPEHDHAGELYAADGGTFPLTNLTSEGADAGTSPVADGAGGITWDDIFPIVVAWKSHREADHTFSLADTWEDIEWDLKVDEECLPGIGFYDEGGVYEDKKILVVSGFEGLLRVAGCVHPEWTGVPSTVIVVATRVVTSNDEGASWAEKRCLQSIVERARGSSEVGTQHYLGTMVAQDGTWIKLQVQVSSTDMLLSGWAGFDHPVAASIEIDSIADYTVAIYS